MSSQNSRGNRRPEGSLGLGSASNNGKPFRRNQRGNGNKTRRPNEKTSTTGTWKRAFAVQENAEGANGNDADDNDDDDVEEVERCIICTNKIQLAGVSDCNHVTCHVCTFRHRALFQKRSCIVCRTENKGNTIITEITDRNYADFSPADIIATNDEYAIGFTSQVAQNQTLDLLKNQCPVSDCAEEFPTFKKLANHVKSVHDRYYCLLCGIHKKAFTCELPLYTAAELKRHQRDGNKKDGFKGHPRCTFCHQQLFYSDDELNIHLREKHERCHVCDRIDPVHPRHFKNYQDLSSHFNEEHFVCPVSSCLEQKFVAFADEFSLKAHMISEHPSLVGNDRTLQSTGGFRSESSTSGRRLRSTLSTFNSPTNPDQEHRDLYDTKKLRLEERARHYLSYSQEKFDQFRKINKDFLHSNRLSAQELLYEYKELFSSQSKTELSLLIQEIGQLVPKQQQAKKQELQDLVEKSLGGNADKFPALGASSMTGSSTSGSKAVWAAAPSGNRSANLFPTLSQSFGSLSFKSPTPQWGSKSGSLSNSTEAFPALKSTGAKPVALNNQVRYRTLSKKKPLTTGPPSLNAEEFSKLRLSDSSASWASSSSSSTSKPKQTASSLEEFPSLPTQVEKAPKVNRSVKYTYMTTKTSLSGKSLVQKSTTSSNGVRISYTKPKTTPQLQVTSHSKPAEPDSESVKKWGKQPITNSDASSNSLATSSNAPSDNTTENGKKKKKQKQVLFRVGI